MVNKNIKFKKQVNEEKILMSKVGFSEYVGNEASDEQEEEQTSNTTLFVAISNGVPLSEQYRPLISQIPEVGVPLKEKTENRVEESMDTSSEEEKSSPYFTLVELGRVDESNWEEKILWDKELSEDKGSLASSNTPINTSNNLFGVVRDIGKKEESVFAVPAPKKGNRLQERIVNQVLSDDSWLESVVWEEGEDPPVRPNTKLILDLNDPQLNLQQYARESAEKRAKLAEKTKQAHQRELEEIQRLIEEEAAASAPAETKKKRGRPPSKKDPESIAAANKTVLSGRLEAKKKEMFTKRIKVRNSIVPSDPYNISNDNQYKANYKEFRKYSDHPKLKRIFVQHALPAQNIEVFKTHFTPSELDNFHRPKFDVNPGERFMVGWKPFEEAAPTPEESFQVLKKPKDYNGLQGNIVLAEYLEEWPPLISDPGMETRLQTFYRKKTPDDETFLHHTTLIKGELVVLEPNDESPFFADLPPGTFVPIFNSNLFRAPVGEHKVPSTVSFKHLFFLLRME